MGEEINETVEGFAHLWGELGNLLNEAERDEDDSIRYREDIATVRHFWSQLGSVINHVRSKNEPKEEVSE